MCQERNCWHFPFKDIPAILHAVGHHFRNSMQMYGNWVPYNLQDFGDYYLIVVPLPGRSKEDVKVSLIDNSLNISAKKPKIAETEDKQEPIEEKPGRGVSPFLKNFFTFIEVNMDIPLRADADHEDVKPRMRNGLLTIRIGKKPPRTINVDGEENK